MRNQNPNLVNKISSDTLSILQGIVQQTAVSLDNMRLIEARQEEAYITAVLLQVAQAVVTQPDLSDTFDTIVNLLPILIGVNACMIYMPVSIQYEPDRFRTNLFNFCNNSF